MRESREKPPPLQRFTCGGCIRDQLRHAAARLVACLLEVGLRSPQIETALLVREGRWA
ncbi:MAG: hypothetical protein IPK78_13495 [Rhodospirillales bacterium]|nr:hypothetical protein [Rhodospirillales bacterium]